MTLRVLILPLVGESSSRIRQLRCMPRPKRVTNRSEKHSAKWKAPGVRVVQYRLRMAMSYRPSLHASHYSQQRPCHAIPFINSMNRFQHRDPSSYIRAEREAIRDGSHVLDSTIDPIPSDGLQDPSLGSISNDVPAIHSIVHRMESVV